MYFVGTMERKPEHGQEVMSLSIVYTECADPPVALSVVSILVCEDIGKVKSRFPTTNAFPFTVTVLAQCDHFR